MYESFTSSLTPLHPLLQYEVLGPYCLKRLFVNGENYGLLGFDNDKILLANRTIDNGNVICMGTKRNRKIWY